LALSGRYLRSESFASEGWDTLKWPVRQSIHLNNNLYYQGFSNIHLALATGIIASEQLADRRVYIGPEANFRGLFKRFGSLQVGHQEELGQYSGRMTFAQWYSEWDAWRRIWLRTAYYSDVYSDERKREFSISLRGDGQINNYLGVRVQAVFRYGHLGFTDLAGAEQEFGYAGHVGVYANL